MSIVQVDIKNFRSILSDSFAPTSLNVVVGANDVGKSNYLRALNLFFNGQTEPGIAFDWKADYSLFAEKKKGKAEEVEISITFQPPYSFKSRELIQWTKVWRKESVAPYRSDKVTAEGNKLGGKQKVDVWLERTKFKYVPAIKSPEYFRSLLRDLHDTLALTIDAELREASEKFLGSLREATKGISSEVHDALAISSKLQLPRSLGNFFEVLDFETSAANGHSISIQQRGDGVKVRHVPAILKFLADQESMLAAKGKPRVTTIWGYEEPENNLELMASFEAARKFRAYSDDIQTFITTHSPAFYSLAKGDDLSVSAWTVFKSSKGTHLEKQGGSQLDDIDRSMGLMKVVAPYVARAESEAQTLRQQLSDLSQAAKPVLFVGGPTDEMFIKKALKVHSKDELLNRFDIKLVGTSSEQGDVFTGDSSLKQSISFLRHNPQFSKRAALFLFDCDARQSDDEFGNVRVRGIPHNNKNAKAKRGIENLLPEDCFLPVDYTTKQLEGEYGVVNSIQQFEKKRFCTRICSLDSNSAEAQRVFSNFGDVIGMIQDWLDTVD